MTAPFAAAIITAIMDWLAIGAVCLTGDVQATIGYAAAVLFAASLIIRARPPAPALLAVLVLAICAPFVLMFRLQWHPVVAVAHVVPVIHALLWFAPANSIYRGWRIGIGFMELVLASGLTTELFLPVTIILFVILASVAISCDFMDRQLAARAPAEQGRPLPHGYIRRSIGLALFIFLSAAVIFPILPRPRAMGLSIIATAGYTERVEIGQMSRISNVAGGAVALRVFPPAGQDLSTEAYLGLIRTRTLENFDGQAWYPASRSRRRFPALPASSVPVNGRVRLEVVREAIGSDFLPVPYGQSDVWFEDSDGTRRRALQNRVGDWLEPGSADRRVHYLVDLIPNDLRYLRERGESDPSTENHLKVPASLRTERMSRLARSLFTSNQSVRDKLTAVGAFYRREGFSVTSEGTPSGSEEGIEQQVRKLGLKPLEQFLFFTKEGHCEWFASGAAVLLRLGGVPTRLVAGFRLTSGQSGGTQTIRTGDGHAWLEAYAGAAGWIPYDPTPRVTKGSSILDSFQAISDLLSARWYRYVVSYESDGSGRGLNLGAWMQHRGGAANPGNGAATASIWQEVIKTLLAPVLLGLTLAAAVGTVVFLYRRRRAQITWGSAHLRHERAQQDRWIRKNRWHVTSRADDLVRLTEARYGLDIAKSLAEWDRIYARLRFGVPPAPPRLREELRSLAGHRRALWRAYRAVGSVKPADRVHSG